MVISTRRRKIARSTVRHVKRNKLSKNMRRLLKRKVSKRKVMKGGGSLHFKIYLVYFTKTKGIFISCIAARLSVNVIGLLFYSEVNNDFFYFGFDRFGDFFKDYNIFENNPKYKIFTPQNDELREGNKPYYPPNKILFYDLAFISYLCGLSTKSTEIEKLKSGIKDSGIGIFGDTVKYCVNLNRRMLTKKLELGYCSKESTTTFTSFDADDNDTETSTKYTIKVVGNFDEKKSLNIPSAGEMPVNIDGVDIYFFLEEVTGKYKAIPRGINVIDAIYAAFKILNKEVGEISEKNILFQHNKPGTLPQSYSPEMKSILSDLDKCLLKHQPQAQ